MCRVFCSCCKNSSIFEFVLAGLFGWNRFKFGSGFYGLLILLQNQLKFSTRFWSVYIEAFTSTDCHKERAPSWPNRLQFHAVFGKFWLNNKLAPCPLGFPSPSPHPPSGKSWIRHSYLCSLMKVFLQCLYNFTMSPHCNVGNKCNQELAAVQPEWTTQGRTNGNQRCIVTNQSQSS